MSIGAKILITGVSNAGKTSLLKTLENAFIVNIDGKPCQLEIPHVNIDTFENINVLIDLIDEKLKVYKEKFGKSPDTIAFDSVSRIFTIIESLSSEKYKGFEVWNNVNKEINTFVNTISALQEAEYNIVLIAHAVWDENAKRYIETCKGSFAKVGGFLSTVDYAVNIDMVGNKRIVTTKGNNLSRTLLDELPEKVPANEFNLQDYLIKIAERSNQVNTKWSI